MYVLQKFNEGNFDKLNTNHHLQTFTLSFESSKQFVKALLKKLLLFNLSNFSTLMILLYSVLMLFSYILDHENDECMGSDNYIN